MTIDKKGRNPKWLYTPKIGDTDEVFRIRSIAYKKWSHMLTRVYSEKYQQNMPTYKLCSTSEEWLNYDNFYEDFIKIPFHWVKEYHFDKDILVKGNKVYENGKCAMIPQRLNSLLFKPKTQIRDLPHGISRYTNDKSIYVATVFINGKNKTVCRSRDLEEAFQAYKEAKEAYIKEVTRSYKGLVCEEVYDALMNWEICIND